MADRELLDELIAHIRKLLTLTDDIYERDIYPVSFFSQAYDLTGRIHESLKDIEIAQIALFERQIKEHQAQIFSTTHQGGKRPDATERPPAHAKTPAEEAVAPPPVPQKPVATTAPAERETPTAGVRQEEPANRPHPPAPPAPAAPLNGKIENAGRQTADLKKWLTLNDRFRFSRELFEGNESLMNRTVAELNRLGSYGEGLAYLKSRFAWNFEDGAGAEFLAVVEKCFHK